MSPRSLSRTVLLLSAFAIFALSNRAVASDCNANGVDDAIDISGGTSADCNANALPDECDIAAGTSTDCNGDGLADDCPDLPVDVVFVIDVSASVSGEMTQVCQQVLGLEAELANLSVMVSTIAFLEIVDSGVFFSCVESSVLNELGAQVPGNGACGPLGLGSVEEPFESWGPATAVVAERFRWRAGTLRVIVPVSDEGACLGGTVCDSADAGAVANAANVAVANDVLVIPIASTDPAPCAVGLMDDLAGPTGGKLVHLYDLAAFRIASQIKAAVRGRTTDCDSNGIIDACDIVGGAADCDGDGRLDDFCDITGQLFVDASVIGGKNDGSTWLSAFSNLQDALFAVEPCNTAEMWVARGTYYPGVTYVDTFSLINGVAIYGGFAGTESSLEERDIAANPTILSGDISQFGTDTAHIVTASASTDATAILDGFTILGGRATVSSFGDLGRGGGVFVEAGAAPTIRNCTFDDNLANLEGGAAYLLGDAHFDSCTFVNNESLEYGGGVAIVAAAPTITGCTFLRNDAFYAGGGIHIDGGAPQVSGCMFGTNGAGDGGGIYATSGATGSVERCTFLTNTADFSGGGMLLLGASPTISDSFFGSNGAIGEFEGGGGIAIFNGSAPVIYNSVFTDNRADFGGGIDLYSNSTATIVNCSFFANIALQSRGGAGLENSNSLGTNMVNSIFWSNADQFGTANQISLFEASTQTSLRISHSNLEGGENAVYRPCPACTLDYKPTNIDADPMFIDPLGPDGHEGTLDDNVRLPGVSPCVDAGSNGAVAGIPTDADGYDRVVFGTVDMGAYEVFVDCNSNALPDVLDLMDYDTNGVVDLRDFHHFQLCFADIGAACIVAFDRAPDCGFIDLDDFTVFEIQLGGPAGAMMMTMGDGLGGGELPLGGEPFGEPEGLSGGVDVPPVVETSTLGFELQPLGGGEALTVLAAHTSYELHYATDADSVNFYLLYAAADSTVEGLDQVEPPLMGPWDDTNAFVFEDVQEVYGALIEASDQPGLYWTDLATSTQYLAPEAEEAAPATGKLCIIKTGDAGELTLELFVLGIRDTENATIVSMEALQAYVVLDTVDETP